MKQGEAWLEFSTDYGPAGYTPADWAVLALFVVAIATLFWLAFHPGALDRWSK